MHSSSKVRPSFRQFFTRGACLSQCALSQKDKQLDSPNDWENLNACEKFWEKTILTATEKQNVQFIPGLGRLVIGTEPSIRQYGSLSFSRAAGPLGIVWARMKDSMRQQLTKRNIKEPFGAYIADPDMRFWHVAWRTESPKYYQKHIESGRLQVGYYPFLHIYPYGVINAGISITLSTATKRIDNLLSTFSISCHPKRGKHGLRLTFGRSELTTHEIFDIVQSSINHALFENNTDRLVKPSESDWMVMRLDRRPQDARFIMGLTLANPSWQQIQIDEFDGLDDLESPTPYKMVKRLNYFDNYSDIHIAGKSALVFIPYPGEKTSFFKSREAICTFRNHIYIYEFAQIKKIVFRRIQLQLERQFRELVRFRTRPIEKIFHEEILRFAPEGQDLNDLRWALDYHPKNLSASYRAFYARVSEAIGLPEIRNSLLRIHERFDKELDKWKHPLSSPLKIAWSALKLMKKSLIS